MFPPGRARLATNPFPTGSGSCAMTMGIVLVASLAARVGRTSRDDDVHLETHQFGSMRGSRSSFPSAYRYSMTMFFPSTYPSSRRP